MPEAGLRLKLPDSFAAESWEAGEGVSTVGEASASPIHSPNPTPIPPAPPSIAEPHQTWMEVLDEMDRLHRGARHGFEQPARGDIFEELPAASHNGLDEDLSEEGEVGGGVWFGAGGASRGRPVGGALSPF